MCGWGLHSTVHLHSCYGGALITDWWRGIFHRPTTSSSTASLGLPLLPVHGELEEYDWQRWSPHAMTNYFSQWFPSWWINAHCVNRADPPLPWAEGRVHPDSELCAMHNHDYYFHRWVPLQAGWWSGHLHSQIITRKHGAGSLSLRRNLVLHRPASLMSFQLAFYTRTQTHTQSFSIYYSFLYFIKILYCETLSHVCVLWCSCMCQTKCSQLCAALYPGIRYELLSTRHLAFCERIFFLSK